MRNLFALTRLSLPKVLTVSPFLGVGLILGLFLESPLFAVASAPLCQELFQDDTPELIRMNPIYRGENSGRYIDPLTNKPWNVRYYTEAEKVEFELVIRNGILVHKDGKKAQSPYDDEAMNWDNGLLVIDANFRIFLLPTEERGVLHHSSLSNGKAVLFAGTAAFHDGYIRELTDSSGHYKPNTQQTRAVLQRLAAHGVDLRQIRLTGYFVKDTMNDPNHISLSPREVPQVFPELFNSPK